MLNLAVTCVPVRLLNGNLVFTDGCRLVKTNGGTNITHSIVIDRPGREPMTVVELFDYELLEELESIIDRFIAEISHAHHEGRTADLRDCEVKETTSIRLVTYYF